MKRALVDLSSVIWTCLLAGKDQEFGKKYMHEDKEIFVNSASYGYENVVNHLTTMMDELKLVPRQLIIVAEGKNSKADRQFIHEGYKAGRERHPAQYEQFNLCKEMVINAFVNLGAQVCWQDGGVEADDVLGYLAINLEGERWIVSGDKDLAQMVGIPGVHHWRSGTVDANPFASFPHKFIPVWIALVGDSGDKIPGARGFGEKAGLKLLEKFGDDGLELMEGLIKTHNLLSLQEDVGELKELQKVIDDADNVYMSYELARLRIERINTLKRPLRWRVGMVKPRAQCEDERLRKWGGQNRIVCAENYAEAVAWARKEIARSPYVSLDIESSTPPESDEWLELQDKDDKVDVFGSELTSLQMTFGPNMQYTVYLPYDNVPEEGVSNLTMDQVMDFVDLVPRHLINWVHNASFELPVCYMSWGAKWADDPEYHGFLRNVRDTLIASSYADENRSKGLKSLSKDLLNYDQVPYDKVTTKDYVKSEWNGKGRVVQTYSEPIVRDTGLMEEVNSGETHMVPVGTDGDGNEILEARPLTRLVPKMEHVGDVEHVVVQHKMNELRARDIFDYGCDDTIVTAALANHFQVIMEIEHTFEAFEEVETFPAYLTALAFVQGVDFSLEDMRAMEEEDDEAYNAAWPVLRDYLMKIGFEGTVCPEMVTTERHAELGGDNAPSHFIPYTPAGSKEAWRHIIGQEIEFKVRNWDKVAKTMLLKAEELDEDLQPRAALLAGALEKGDLGIVNDLFKQHFVGEPQLDLASPKQMTRLLYDHMKLPIRVINDVTVLEKMKVEGLDAAVRKFKQLRAGKTSVGAMTEKEMLLLRKKAKADDTAIDMAVAFDTDYVDDEARAVLKAIGTMKKVMTRRSLFYKNYWHAKHWKDGKIHASANQCAAVTRRYSMSMPNLQQLPKKGQAVRFRGCFKPHHKGAVINSIDYSGQELRLAAERSQDKNMLACYVGDKLKDIHSITAAGAMKLKWGAQVVKDLFDQYGKDLAHDDEGQYELFVRIHKTLGKENPLTKKADDLRKESKNVNFGAQNGAKAVKLSETLIMPVADAQLFLDARSAMFPDVDRAAERAAEHAKKTGLAFTLMGVRRHLGEAVLSDERGAADRAARQAWNYEIQGSAGEMTKLGMARLWKSGIYFRYDARFIAPIHDELVSSVSAEHAADFIREKHACMTVPYATMKVPVWGSISLGPDFAKQIECGDWFIEENVRGAVNDIFALKEAA